MSLDSRLTSNRGESTRKKKKKKKNRGGAYTATMASGEVRSYRSAKSAIDAQRSSFANSAKSRKRREQEEKRLHLDKPRQRKKPIFGPESGDKAAYSFYDKTTKSEQRFLRFAATRGLLVHRNGWPDFFCDNPDGGIACVEVKMGIDDPLRPSQVTCINMLSEAGIETWIWNPQHSKHYGLPALIPWRQYISSRLRRDLSAQATGRASKSVESDPEDQAHATPVSEDGRIPEVLEGPRVIH